MQSCCIANLRPCQHVSVFIWKRNFFFTDTTSVHTYAMKTINENGTFRKRFPGNFLKTLFSRVRVDRRKWNFSKTLRTHYQFQSSPRNIRNLFKLADGRFPFLSFIECFHSRGQHLCKFIGTKESVCKERIQLRQDWFGTPTWPPFHCFGTPIWPSWRHVKTLHTWANCLFSSKFSFVNSSSCLLQDYSGRRQNIIRLISVPMSRGGRLDLPLVWICFCPDFDVLNCFCDFENITTI